MKSIVCVIAIIAAGTVAAGQGPLQSDLREQLFKQIDAVTSTLHGVVGYRIVDLTSGGQVAARLERQPFPTASTIKLAILYEMFTMAEAGSLDLDTPKSLDTAQVVGGSGVLQHLRMPLLSLRDHAALMVIVSDNTSTNVMIDAVGMNRVNARMAGLGLGDIRLRRKMMDDAAVARGDENVASPASLTRIVEMLWKGDGLKPESRDEARRILARVGGQIRGAVPASVPVYEKTGGLPGVRAEAAVVDLPGRPFAITVMTTYLANDPDGDRAIRDIAAAAFSYFERLATGGAFGRKQP